MGLADVAQYRVEREAPSGAESEGLWFEGGVWTWIPLAGARSDLARSSRRFQPQTSPSSVYEKGLWSQDDYWQGNVIVWTVVESNFLLVWPGWLGLTRVAWLPPRFRPPAFVS